MVSLIDDSSNTNIDVNAGPKTRDTYRLVVEVTGDGDYQDYTKTFKFYVDGDKQNDESVHYTADVAKTWGNDITLTKNERGESRTPNTEKTFYAVKDNKRFPITITPKDASKGEYVLTGSKNLEPGKYSIDIEFNDNEEQKQTGKVKNFQFEITKRNLSVDPVSKDVAYKGEAYYPFRDYSYSLKDANTVIKSDAKGAKVAGEGVKKDANDDYYVIDSGDYTLSFDLSGTFKKDGKDEQISKWYNNPSNATFSVVGNREQSVTLTALSKEYDGDPAQVKAVGQSTGDVKYTYKDASGKVLAGAPTDAGKYTVTATVAGDKNYKSGSATKSFEITQKAIDVDLLKKVSDNLTYNGKKQVPDTTLKFNGVDPELTQQNEKQSIHRTNVLTSGKDFKLEVAKNDDGTYVGDHSAVLTLLNKNYKLVDRHLANNDRTTIGYNLNAGKETEVDSATVTYTIEPLELKAKDTDYYNANVTVEDAEPGKTPVVHVYAEDGSEIPSDDYSVKAINNNKVGTGKVTVAGIKNAKAGVKNVDGSVTFDYNVVAQATVEKTDLYRLYNKNTGEHFFTTNAGEKDNLVKAGWNFEGVAMKTVKDGGTPVYRLYNKNNGGEHVYTTSKGEANSLVRAGWAYEGVAFNAAKKGDKDAVKVYRVYNPNKVANNHHYTQSWGEKTVLVKQGWRDEGVAFYAYKAL